MEHLAREEEQEVESVGGGGGELGLQRCCVDGLGLRPGGGDMGDISSYNWARDLPQELAQIIVNKYSSQYEIFQITRTNGYKLSNVRVVTEPLKNLALFAFINQSKKRFFIDSCLQHAAAALGMPSTVFWIGTSSTTFGYKLHNNIHVKKAKIANQLIYSQYFDYQFLDNEQECPYNNFTEMFDSFIINNL